MHFELREGDAFVLRSVLKWNAFRERLGGNHCAAGMNRGVTGNAFKAAGGIDDFFSTFVGFIKLLQLGHLFECFIEVFIKRNELCELVAEGEFDIE